jgi:cholesterol oxidase
MKTPNRRQFGTGMLQLAAALGFRSIAGSRIIQLASSGSALGAVGCGSSAGPAGAATPSRGPSQSGNMPYDASVREGPGEGEEAGDEKAPAPSGDAGSVPSTADHLDVVIVGSGYGGAVIAKRLTEKGVSVLMLEMGRFWNTPGSDGKIFCGIKNPDGRALWFRNNISVVSAKMSPVAVNTPIAKQAGVLDVIETPDIDVFCGRGVGGGSLVNMAMLVTPPQDVLHAVLPTVDAAQMMSTYYPRALAMLKANTIGQAFFNSTSWYEYARVGHSAAAAAGFDAEFLPSGYDYSYMEKEAAGQVPSSALGYEAGFGNNYGKQSLDKTYLADAIATGNLTIESLHIVKQISQNPDGTYLVLANAIDIEGNLVAQKVLTCNRLFLCGGSMGTSELLVRARDTGSLSNLNDQVGTGWGPNSDIFLMRDNSTSNPTGSQVSTVPATGFRTTDQNGKAVFAMDIPFPAGIETYISFSIVMTQNPESGTFRYNVVTDAAELDWTESQNAPAVASAQYVFDKINVATGSSYATGMLGGKEFQDTATYHAVGGCPLGQATDDYGRVKGYQNLYVSDGSLIPLGIVANPALTVAALTERNIERILKEDFKL